VTGDPPLNNSGAPIGGDYIAFHAAGRLVLQGRGGEIYDKLAIVAIQDELLGGRIPNFYDAYRNPPFFVLPFVPLAALDLLPGFAVFSLLSLGCLGAAIWLIVDEVPHLKSRWRGLVILSLAFAPIYFGVINGQNATLSLLLYVLIYRAIVHRHDVAAGVWSALGMFKPQLFFVFPLILLVLRRWRALAACAVTLVGLGLISLLISGVDGLRAWVRILIEPEQGNAVVNAWRMASVKSLLDMLLPEQAPLVWGLYGGVALVLLIAVLALWGRVRHRPSQAWPPLPLIWVFTCLVAVLIDPHLVDYDLSVLLLAGVFAVAVPELRWLSLVLVLLLPLRPAVPLGIGALQVTTVLLLLGAGLTWRRLTVRRLALQAQPEDRGLAAAEDLFER
jgi:hypothetical protein